MNDSKYASLLDRIKALFIDFIVLMGLGIAASIILSKFDNVPDYVRISAFVFVFFLYDPIFVSSLGGTLGQLIMNLRVRKEKDESKKVLFHIAILRFSMKLLLGWLSLLTVSNSTKKKAIHDMVVGSVVIQDVVIAK